MTLHPWAGENFWQNSIKIMYFKNEINIYFGYNCIKRLWIVHKVYTFTKIMIRITKLIMCEYMCGESILLSLSLSFSLCSRGANKLSAYRPKAPKLVHLY